MKIARLFVCLLVLISFCGCGGVGSSTSETSSDSGSSGDGSSNEGDGYNIYTSGTGNGQTVSFLVKSGSIIISVSHANDSRIVVSLMDKQTQLAKENIVIMNIVADQQTTFTVPPGDYYLKIKAIGNWTIKIYGDVTAYAAEATI